jgi:hypothetical protein
VQRKFLQIAWPSSGGTADSLPLAARAFVAAGLAHYGANRLGTGWVQLPEKPVDLLEFVVGQIPNLGRRRLLVRRLR